MVEAETRLETNALLTQSGLLDVTRHCQGDAVITLNVGGKEFFTLRSTVASNQVLAEHVARAEANQEFTHGGRAVFIDRDPTHFPLILNHLRNKVSGLTYYSTRKSGLRASNTRKSRDYHVQLPKDLNQLRDIYVEAQHYRIEELRAASCEQNVIVTILSALGGGGSNPFDQATKLFQNLRLGLLTFGGVSTVAIGSQNTDMKKTMTTLFPVWFPPQKDDEESGLGKESSSTPAVA
jgi:BTB/POZ domain